MNSKLFVGNLNFATREEELRQTFEPFGSVRSVTIVTDRMTGQPRGFAFVEYETADEAQRAIDELNGSELGGRALNISVARERTPGPRFGGGGGERGFGGDRGFGGGGGGDRGFGGGGGDRGGRGGGGRGNKSNRGANRW